MYYNDENSMQMFTEKTVKIESMGPYTMAVTANDRQAVNHVIVGKFIIINKLILKPLLSN
jgi:hypothetical protein